VKEAPFFPVELVPDDIVIEPPLPAVALPVLMSTFPDDPEFEFPVLISIAPLTPLDPLSDVFKTMDPLDFEVPIPEESETVPPVPDEDTPPATWTEPAVPLAPVDAPPERVTLPPADDAAEVAPPEIMVGAPSPEFPEPLLTLMCPDVPPTAEPVAIVIAPVLPELYVPLSKRKAPLIPAVPAFAELTTSPPEDFDCPIPEISETCPPVLPLP
jgi:hypothetical protein